MNALPSSPNWASSCIPDLTVWQHHPLTHCQNSLLCQTSSDHWLLLHLPSKIFPPILLSPPTSCSRPGSNFSLAFQLWPCPLRSIIHTAATLNTKLHCFKLPITFMTKSKPLAWPTRLIIIYPPLIHLSGLSFSSGIPSFCRTKVLATPIMHVLSVNVTVHMRSHFPIHFLSSRGQFQFGLQDSAQMYLLCEAFPDPDISKLN